MTKTPITRNLREEIENINEALKDLRAAEKALAEATSDYEYDKADEQVYKYVDEIMLKAASLYKQAKFERENLFV